MLRTSFLAIERPLGEAELTLVRADQKLAGLDLDKLVFDREQDLGKLEKRLAVMAEDLQYFYRLRNTLENAPRTEDDQAVLRDLYEELEPLEEEMRQLKGARDVLKEKMVALHKMKEASAKHSPNKKEAKKLIERTDELDQEIASVLGHLSEVERRWGKLSGAVAKIELEMKHDDTRDGLNEMSTGLKEMETELVEMKEFVSHHPSTEEQKLAAEEIAGGLPKAEMELGEMRVERDRLKKELDGVRESVKKYPKPRTFEEAKWTYVRIKEIDRDLTFLERGRLDPWRKNFEQLQKARLAANKAKAPPMKKYVAQKKDPVDKLLADFMNTTGCQVPIRRLGNGYYFFGSKKIYAKIMNGKLVIRVGGGYMSIEEFVHHYAQQELNRQEQLAFAKDVADTTKGQGEGRRQTVMGIQQAKKSLAARRSMRVPAGEEHKVEGASDLESMLRDIERKGATQSPGRHGSGYKTIKLPGKHR